MSDLCTIAEETIARIERASGDVLDEAINQAPHDLRALIAEVRRLREQVEFLVGQLRKHEDRERRARVV